MSAGEREAVLECDGLRKTYGSVVAVSDFTLTVGRGELWALVGPNGCGKTTSIEAAIGLRARDAGTVRCFGVDPAKDPRALIGRIGVQLQGATIHPSIKVREHLQYVAASFEQDARMAETIDVFRLGDQMNQQFGRLSGGTQRRVLVAAAYLVQPDLLILDEPTSGVDPEARIALWSSLVRAARNEEVAVLVTTHDLHEAERYLQRFAIMNAGRVLAAGSLVEVREQLGTQAVLSADEDALAGDDDLSLRHRVLDDRVLVGAASEQELAGVAVGGGNRTVRPASLEDLYLLYASGAGHD